jgi:hypothetical protein
MATKGIQANGIAEKPAPITLHEDREEEFKKLCERVERINPEAAKYLRECPEGEGPGQCMRCGNLQVVLAWHDTPQGFDYWDEIYLILNAETTLDGEWVKE